MSLQNKFNLGFFSKQAVMYVLHHINFTVILSRVFMLKRFLDKSNGFYFMRNSPEMNLSINK